MNKTEISTPLAPAPGGSFSQAIAATTLVAVSGQVGADPTTGALPTAFADEVAAAIRNLRLVLEAAGLGLEHVIKTTCFLTDVTDFGTFNAVYQEHFERPYPARSTIGVALAGDLRFEIEALAVRPETQ